MRQFSESNLRITALFCGLAILTCSGIWSVGLYVNQDGMPHLYNAFLIREIVSGNEAISQFVSLNPALIPNLTGHWILAGLLTLFSPAISTKIFVSMLFVGLAFSAFWLRLQVVGRENYVTALLLSFVLAFNWMWFLGFYNFILGAIGFGFTLGLWWRWRENLNLWRSFVLFLLLLFVFFSHLICFAILAGTLFLLCLTNWRADYFKKTAIWTFAAILLVLPFFFNYLILSKSNASLAPSWGFLENSFSVSNWILHLRSADPFQLISRKAIPFFETASPLFALFSSSLWLVIALFCLTAGSFIYFRKENSPEKIISFIWFAVSISLGFLWIVAPNDFGKSHGGFLRERVLLLALICFLPVFRLANRRKLEITAQVCLGFVIIFQTLVVWSYAQEANRTANEILEAKQYIADNESFGSIIVNRTGCKFKPVPRSNLTPFIAMDKNTKVLDNYELGYYLFPVIARRTEDRQFIYDFRESNTYDFCDPQEQFEAKFDRLSNVLENNHAKIDVLLVWGKDEKIENLINRWFESEPYFNNGSMRLFRLRKTGN